jgi:hypothetical protein
MAPGDCRFTIKHAHRLGMMAQIARPVADMDQPALQVGICHLVAGRANPLLPLRS